MHWFVLMILLVILLLGLLYVICVLPQVPSRPFGRRTQVLYAGGGLWDAEAPEGSLPAFRRAADRGLGIALTVQPRQDGELMVFPDESLERLCGIRKPLARCSAHDLWDVRLGRSNCTIPTLAQVLQEVDGRVPLLVEIRTAGRTEDVCARTDALLTRYPGLYSVAAADPRVLSWYRKNRREVYRGQITPAALTPRRRPSWRALLDASLLQNLLSRPDFILCEPRTPEPLPLRLVRAFHPVMIARGIARQEELPRVLEAFDTAVCGGFVPEQPDGESCPNPDQFSD